MTSKAWFLLLFRSMAGTGDLLRLMTTRIFFLFYFLRDHNSQHFNQDLLGVNASAFSFFLCFKATDYSSATNYVISTNWTTVENFWWNFSLIRMFSRETITDVHWHLDCLNFNYCPVGISHMTHLSISKVFRSDCLFVNFKPQTNTADKRVLLL